MSVYKHEIKTTHWYGLVMLVLCCIFSYFLIFYFLLEVIPELMNNFNIRLFIFTLLVCYANALIIWISLANCFGKITISIDKSLCNVRSRILMFSWLQSGKITKYSKAKLQKTDKGLGFLSIRQPKIQISVEGKTIEFGRFMLENQKIELIKMLNEHILKSKNQPKSKDQLKRSDAKSKDF
tara:strand:+ start:651 stop:1193 length:543 start_codon:yes stop_codon:yes gene_type:complete